MKVGYIVLIVISGFYIVLIVISGFILLSGILFLIYYKSVMWKIYHYPRDNPFNYVKKMKKRRKTSKKARIVFIGDSLTHGNISVNYIKMIAKKLGKNCDYINAGMNAELAYNVLLRIESIIACKPDFITILIGTNDANGELRDIQDKKSIEMLNLPRKPDKEWFKENLEKIVSKLKEETEAKIALCSIPIMGEETSSKYYKQSIDYSKTIYEIANKHKISYLPINEKMIDYLKKHPSNPKYPYEKRLVEEAAYKNFLFRKSFDEISEEYGFSLLVDHIHINTEGAKIIADLMLEFILSK